MFNMNLVLKKNMKCLHFMNEVGIYIKNHVCHCEITWMDVMLPCAIDVCWECKNLMNGKYVPFKNLSMSIQQYSMLNFILNNGRQFACRLNYFKLLLM